MPAKKEYTAEFKEQAVRFVLDESRKHACDRLAPKLSVKAVTLYNWVKQSAPAKARPTSSPGSVEELRLQNAALRKENRELARANAILSDAAAFSGRRSTAKRGSSVRGCSPSSWATIIDTDSRVAAGSEQRSTSTPPWRTQQLASAINHVLQLDRD